MPAPTKGNKVEARRKFAKSAKDYAKKGLVDQLKKNYSAGGGTTILRTMGLMEDGAEAAPEAPEVDEVDALDAEALSRLLGE
jgi:hypothetical protein